MRHLTTLSLSWLCLLAPLGAAQTPCAWQAKDTRLVVVDVESEPPTGQWAVQSQFPGYGGESYYRWVGPDHFNQPGNGLLAYTIEVHEAGRYELRIHNRHENSDSTLENDCWVRMDGGSWIKLYSNGSGSVAQWNWKSRFDIGGNHYDAGWDLSLGRHRFEISARSSGFAIDRFHFFKGNPAGHSNVQTALSPCRLGGSYCSSGRNSSGGAARIDAGGSLDVDDDALVLTARPVPAHTIGLFYFGSATADLAFGNGRRCIGGNIWRLPPTIAQGTSLRTQIDFDISPADHIQAGSTWHFQAWFRDPQAGGSAFDLSDGLHLNFLP